MRNRYLLSLMWLATMALPLTGTAQHVGPEFQVNTYTTDGQLRPSVASDENGNFVVVWESSQDGSGGSIVGQRYDNSGSPLGGEFQINTYTTGDQFSTEVASDASGNFVVVWEDLDGHDGSYEGIFGQRYDNGGNRRGGEFQVNSHTLGYQRSPSIASDANGNFVVVWNGSSDIFGQRYDNDGNPLGSEFTVNTYTTGDQRLPSVASDANGNFVAVWSSYRYGGSGFEVFGQRYDSGGNTLGGEFHVNTHAFGDQFAAGIASDAGGDFIVLWYSSLPPSASIQARRYDRSGNPLGDEFQVNTHTESPSAPSIASDAGGNFVVVWQSYHDGSSSGVFGQRYDSDGNSLGSEFPINTYTTSYQSVPSVASDASGNFVVAWGSYGQDGSAFGVFGQRFAADCEASLQIQADVHTPGSTVVIQVHIAHHRPKTVTVPWEMSLIDPSGQVVAKHATPPHTFEPGDVVDKDVELQLPQDLESGTYTLRLAISGMAGTKGATATFRVVRAE